MKIITLTSLSFVVISCFLFAGCSSSENLDRPRVSNLANAEKKAKVYYDWRDDETLRVRASSAYPDYSMIRDTLIADVDEETGNRKVEIEILEQDRIVVDTRNTTVPIGGVIGGLVSIGVSELHKEVMDPEPGDQFWVYYVDAEVRLKEGDVFDRYEFDSTARSKAGNPRGR